MRTILAVFSLCGGLLGGQEFSIQIANAVAGNSPGMKQAAFVLRPLGCDGAELKAAAEGRVNGERKTVELKLAPLPANRGFAVMPNWPREGVWVVNISGTCGGAKAGALVAVGENGMDRERSTLLSRHATESDIAAALQKAPRK